MRRLTDQETCRRTQLLPHMCRFESGRGCQFLNGCYLLFGFCPNLRQHPLPICPLARATWLMGRYGAKSPLEPARGSAGQKAQNRQTPPPISAPQEVKHNFEQRRIQALHYRGSLDSCRGILNRLCIGLSLHGDLPEPCSVMRQDGPCGSTQWMRPDRAFTSLPRRAASRMPRVAARPLAASLLRLYWLSYAASPAAAGAMCARGVEAAGGSTLLLCEGAILRRR
jgi:hypothetical protein